MGIDPTERGDLAARAARHRALGDPIRLAVVDALVAGDLTPGELGDVVGLPANHLAFHLRTLEAAELVAVRRSEGDGRRRYVTLRPAAAVLVGRGAGADRAAAPAPVRPPRRPVFVCTRNAARSQLAAALWTATTGRPAASAGTAPADAVDPRAVRVAADRGLDLGDVRPRHVDDLAVRPDLVVSVCDRVREAPLPFAAPTLHWSVPDPAGRPVTAYRAAHDELADRVARLAAATGLGVAA